MIKKDVEVGRERNKSGRLQVLMIATLGLSLQQSTTYRRAAAFESALTPLGKEVDDVP